MSHELIHECIVKKTFLIQSVINDGWHVLQRILIKGTMFLLKVISAGLNGWKKKKRKLVKVGRQILWVSIIYNCY